jgi:hypothetical protein
LTIVLENNVGYCTFAVIAENTVFEVASVSHLEI